MQAPISDKNARTAFLKSIGVPIVGIVAAFALGFGIDLAANPYLQFVILLILTNVVMASSLNLVSGFTGQFSLGHAGFMAVGAYVSAFLAMTPEAAQVPELLRYLLLPVASGLAAAAAGYVVGLPSLRLRGDYLAIVTLGFGEIIRVVILNSPAIGGARGLYGIPATQGIASMGLSPYAAQFGVAGTWCVLALVTLWRLVHSARGRAFLSVREDEIAAEAMGINVTQVKVRAFVISSFFAGVGGSLFAHSVKYLNPATFTFTKSVDFIIMIVLGGMGSFSGSILAAAIITVLPELVLRELQQWTGVDLRMVIYSLLLILFMILRPTGIFGTRELPEIIRNLRHKGRAHDS